MFLKHSLDHDDALLKNLQWLVTNFRVKCKVASLAFKDLHKMDLTFLILLPMWVWSSHYSSWTLYSIQMNECLTVLWTHFNLLSLCFHTDVSRMYEGNTPSPPLCFIGPLTSLRTQLRRHLLKETFQTPQLLAFSLSWNYFCLYFPFS